MKIRIAIPSLMVFVLLLGSTSMDARAQQMDDRTNAISTDKEATGTTPVDEVGLASQLIDYGMRHDDATALVAAARILVQTGATASAAREDDADAAQTQDEKPDGETVEFSAEALLDEAAQIGGEGIDEQIAAVRARITQDRGRAGGPGVTHGTVSARSTDSWNLGNFVGGEYARVIVDGDGDTDLDCYIYDDNGYAIDSDEDYTDYCVLEWVPRYTGGFYLRIRNLGSVWNAYRVSTN